MALGAFDFAESPLKWELALYDVLIMNISHSLFVRLQIAFDARPNVDINREMLWVAETHLMVL